jgi:hypothetical protein
VEEELVGETLHWQVPARARHVTQSHGGRVDRLVFTQHPRHLGTKRIGEWKHGAHRLRPLAAREGREQAQWRERDLFLADEVRIQHRSERACSDSHLPRRPRRREQRLVDFLMLGADRRRYPKKALLRALAGVLRSQSKRWKDQGDCQSTDECAAM